MFLVRLLHTRSPQSLSLVFVLSGFKFGVFLFAVGRDGGRIDLLQRKESKTGKMEPDKDSKIEAKRIRNTQKRAITHNWTIPSRGPEFEPLGSKWNPNGIH